MALSRAARRRGSITIAPQRITEIERVYAREVRRLHARVLEVLRDSGALKQDADPEAGLLKLLGAGPALDDTIGRILDRLRRSVDTKLGKAKRVRTSSLIGEAPTRAIVRQHAELIKVVSRQHVERVIKLYETPAFRAAPAAEQFAKVSQVADVSTNRAKFWARDQLLSNHAKITEVRARSAGVTDYIWTSSGTGVRDTHAELDGKQFSFSDPPVTSEQGDTNNPGEDYNCRCTAYLVI